MGTRGILFALSGEDEQRLLQARTPSPPKGLFSRLGLGPRKAAGSSAVIDFLSSVEERWDEAWLCETDSSWDAIHRALGDGTLSHSLVPVGKGAILGGEQLYEGDAHLVSYKDSKLVRQVAAVTQSITNEDMGALYDGIDQDAYGFPKDADDRAYTVDWFAAIRDFYAKAAEAGRAVVFHVSQ